MANFALQFNGSTNFMSLGTLGDLGSNLANGFYIKFQTKTTTTAVATFGCGATGKEYVQIAFNRDQAGTAAPGKISIGIRNNPATKTLRAATSSATSFNDGSDHWVEIYVLPAINSVTIKVDDVSQSITYNEQQSPVEFVNFTAGAGGASLTNEASNFFMGSNNYNGVKGEYFNGIFDTVLIGVSQTDLYGIYLMDDGAGTTVINSSTKAGNAGIGGSPLPSWVTGLAAVTYPIISSATATEITATSAKANGSMPFNGGGTVTAQGFCYGTSVNPTTANSIASVTPDTIGDFNTVLSGLTTGQIYHYRAYATNAKGTSYGADRQFTAGAVMPTITSSATSDLTRTSVTASASITSDGGADIAERGFVIGASTNPTIADTKYIISGTTGSYNASITGLTPATSYHIRAYAINGAGISYGTDLPITTNPNTAPVMTSSSVVIIKQKSAIGSALITDDGGATITERGFVINTSPTPTTANTKFTAYAFTSQMRQFLTGLTPATTYYCRPYAINSVGTAYGSEATFTTAAIAAPRMTGYYDMPAVEIAQTTATATGIVMDDGGDTITERGFVVNTSPNPTTAHTKVTVAGSDAWFMHASLTGLTADTTYYYRAYATNSVGTSYGKNEAFKTKKVGDRTKPKIHPFFGLNIGNNVINGGATEPAIIQADVQYHKECGLKWARIASMTCEYVYGKNAGSYGTGKRAAMRDMVQQYIAAGINVQYTIQAGDWTTPRDFPTQWIQFLSEEVDWAISVGVKRIQVENEMEIKTWMDGSVNSDKVWDWYQDQSVIVRSRGFEGLITVALVPDNDTSWTARGRGFYDELGFDSYGTIDQFINKNTTFLNTHGDRGYLSEWGMQVEENYFFNFRPSYTKRVIITKMKWAQGKLPYHPSYYHTWKNINDAGSGNPNQDNWSATMLTGQHFLFWFAMIEQRSPITF